MRVQMKPIPKMIGLLLVLGAVAITTAPPPAYASIQCGAFDDFSGNCICYIIDDNTGQIKGWIRYQCD